MTMTTTMSMGTIMITTIRATSHEDLELVAAAAGRRHAPRR